MKIFHFFSIHGSYSHWMHWFFLSIHSFLLFMGLVGRLFVNDLGDLGSIPGCVIPKTLKMVLDTSLLNTQQYKIRIKGKVKQSWKGVAPFQLSDRPRLRSPTLFYLLRLERVLIPLISVIILYIIINITKALIFFFYRKNHFTEEKADVYA